MTTRLAGRVLVLLVLGASTAAAQVAEILGEVRVHGNHTTPDADILSLAGLTIGAPVTDALLNDAAARLRASGRFDNVDVRKRYRSIERPEDVLVIIVVDEVAGVTSDDLTPGPLKRMRSLGMWLPVLDYADGYGFTYGARVSFVDALGKRSRISMPLTWGGERKAGIEVERSFRSGPFTRIEGGGFINRRKNPHYDLSDTRRQVHARVERAWASSAIRVGGGARLTRVRFGGSEETYVVPSVDVTVDTRTDPAFPRDAIHATAAVEQLRFQADRTVVRTTTDVRGYVGLFGSSVLALRAMNVRSDAPLPPYEQPLLGGVSTVRGFDFGYRVGDNLAAYSAELRIPVTSPVSMGRLGVKAFIDAGTVYASGLPLRGQRFDRGAGGGVFMSWAVIRMGLDIAWPMTTSTHSPRWHFGLGVSF
jgi:outer membrane protein assembly factor BamA